MFDLELMRRLSAVAAMTEVDTEEARSARDYDEGLQLEGKGPRHPYPTLTDDEIATLVSNEARMAVIGFEVTSEAVYKKKYERPIAPAGQSGITIGIGYDLGWNKPENVRQDFAGLISAEDIETLIRACGVRGDEARRRRPEFNDIRVPWDAAIEAFRRATTPRFGRKVLMTFPNAVDTKGHAFGALFSLIYNRGESLELGGRLTTQTALGQTPH
jgi:hypothetical protein